MIKLSQKGNWSKTRSFTERALNMIKLGRLDKYGQMGIDALSAATPKDTGKTSHSWTYKIVRKKDSVSIEWRNANANDGVLIVILLQYGHGNQNGSYVEGTDFINPAMRKVFKEIADDAWEEMAD
jgi:hypothetical protein